MLSSPVLEPARVDDPQTDIEVSTRQASTTAGVRPIGSSRANSTARLKARTKVYSPAMARRLPTCTSDPFHPCRNSMRCRATGPMSSAVATVHGNSVTA